MLTLHEKQIVRLVHHDFRGLQRKQAAKELGISVSRVNTILKNVRCKAPFLFPILKQNQAKVLKTIQKTGNYKKAAKKLKMKLSTFYKIIKQLKDKGFVIAKPKTIRYEPFMDVRVIRKF